MEFELFVLFYVVPESIFDVNHDSYIVSSFDAELIECVLWVFGLLFV